jgi:hypothetical protein
MRTRPVHAGAMVAPTAIANGSRAVTSITEMAKSLLPPKFPAFGFGTLCSGFVWDRFSVNIIG